MQTKETMKDAVIFLEKEEDFFPKNLEVVFTKIKEYKKLPFHDVILKINIKYFVKFWEFFYKKNLNWKTTEINNDMILFKI
jgi:hypothetical protein